MWGERYDADESLSLVHSGKGMSGAGIFLVKGCDRLKKKYLRVLYSVGYSGYCCVIFVSNLIEIISIFL